MFTDVALHEVVQSVNELEQLSQRRTGQVTEDGKNVCQIPCSKEAHHFIIDVDDGEELFIVMGIPLPKTESANHIGNRGH